MNLGAPRVEVTRGPSLFCCRALYAFAYGSAFEFSFHVIQTIELKFTIDKYTQSMVPLRVLSRTNLARFALSTSSISFISFRLRTLKLSCRSFSHPDPLFSITSALFLQNTRGVGYLKNLPSRISNFRTLFPAPVANVATEHPAKDAHPGRPSGVEGSQIIPHSPLATRHSPLSSWELLRCTEAQKCLSVSPLLATLTHSVSRKSFPCHSYANTRDGGATLLQFPPPSWFLSNLELPTSNICRFARLTLPGARLMVLRKDRVGIGNSGEQAKALDHPCRHGRGVGPRVFLLRLLWPIRVRQHLRADQHPAGRQRRIHQDQRRIVRRAGEGPGVGRELAKSCFAFEGLLRRAARRQPKRGAAPGLHERREGLREQNLAGQQHPQQGPSGQGSGQPAGPGAKDGPGQRGRERREQKRERFGRRNSDARSLTRCASHGEAHAQHQQLCGHGADREPQRQVGGPMGCPYGRDSARFRGAGKE